MLDRFFGLSENRTTVRTELVAGLITFLTMAYIIFVQPAVLGQAGMETLAAWVRETGAGLLMTGGHRAYAPGGYFRSPLEPILPVSMELRHEHRKLALAIVVALDRSGSMAMPVAGGRVKMDLANLGTVQVLDLLGPQDELGVLAVDTEPHVIHAIGPVKDPARVRRTALARGLKTAAELATLSDAEAQALILTPGFSTAERVTEVSGRGVGMDVVKTNVEQLRGSLQIESTPGAGTCTPRSGWAAWRPTPTPAPRPSGT